jgi:hypothetical protein
MKGKCVDCGKYGAIGLRTGRCRACSRKKYKTNYNKKHGKRTKSETKKVANKHMGGFS